MGRFRASIDPRTGKIKVESLIQKERPAKLNWQNAVSNKKSLGALTKYENRFHIENIDYFRIHKNKTKSDISNPTGDIKNIQYGGRPEYKDGEIYNGKTGKIEKDTSDKLTQEQIENLRNSRDRYYSKGEPLKEPRIVKNAIPGGQKFNSRFYFPWSKYSEIKKGVSPESLKIQTGLDVIKEDPVEEQYEIQTQDLVKMSYVQKYLNQTETPIEGRIENLVINAIPERAANEQIMNIVMSGSRDKSEGFSAALKRNNAKRPNGLSLSKYSTKVSKAKEELSINALKQYTLSRINNVRTYDFVREGKASGYYDGKDADSVLQSRDFYRVILKSGTDPETVQENRRRLDHYLLKGVDKSKYTEAEYNNLTLKHRAEVFNKRMEELANIDYSKFDHMTDEELVKNWTEYAGIMNAISVFKVISDDYKKGRNPYINQELLRKVDEIEWKYNPIFLRDSGRIRAISNPYYSKYDFSGFEKISPSEISNLGYGPTSGNNNLSTLFNDLGTQHTGSKFVFFNDIVQDMNKTADGISQKDLSFFDANGKALTEEEDIFMAAKKGAIFAAPKDRPDLLKPYGYDPKLLGGKELNPNPYTKVMKKIQSQMPDITKTWAEEEEMLEGGSYESFIKSSSTIYNGALGMAQQIQRSENPQKMKDAMMSALKRNMAPNHPNVDYDEYAKLVGLSAFEKLSKATVEERRKLTERTVTGLVEYQLNKPSCSNSVDSLIKGTSKRQFESFMLRSGDSVAKNDKVVKEFFNGDANTKKRMILDRVAEYKTQIDAIYGKNLSDKDIVDNLKPIAEVAQGMGMEYVDTILKNQETWGLNFSEAELKMMNDLHTKADEINSEHVMRLNIIGTPHYQFGGLEKLAFGENSSNYSELTKDEMFNKSFNNVSMSITIRDDGRGAKLLRQADPSGKLKVDFAFDANGNEIPANKYSEIGKKAFESGQLFVFFEGQEKPVVLNCKDADKIPPVSTVAEELTKEMESKIDNMRKEHALNQIDQNKELTVEMKELEKNILYKGFEIETIAANANASPKNRDVLKKKMAEYMASITIKRMVDKDTKKLDSEYIKTLTSPEAIKKLTSDLKKSPITDLVIDDMLKTPNGFKNIDSHAVYSNMLKQMVNANKILMEEKKVKVAKTTESLKTISENKKYLVSEPNSADRKLFGLTSEILSKLESTTKMKSMSISRTTVQSQAIGLMLDKGLTVDQIFEDTPKMQQLREAAAKQVMNELANNKVGAVLTHLYIGEQKLNEYVKGKFQNMKELSLSELRKPENRNLIKVMPLMKDLFQELNTVNNDYIPKGSQLSGKEFDEMGATSDAYNKVIGFMMQGVQQPLQRMIDKGKNFNPSEEMNDAIVSYVKGRLCVEAIKAAAALPENKGKSLEELWHDDKVQQASVGALLQIMDNDNYSKLIEKCSNNKTFANKIYRSILDDTLKDDIDIKVNYNEEGAVVEFNTERLKKSMDDKLSVDIPSSLNKVETEMQQKKEIKEPINKDPKVMQQSVV